MEGKKRYRDKNGNGDERKDKGGTGTGAGTETRTERRMEGRGSPGAYKVVVETVRKTRERW